MSRKEKTLLIVLVVASFIFSILVIYFNVNKGLKEQSVINDKIKLLVVQKDIEPENEKRINKNMLKTGTLTISYINDQIEPPNLWNKIALDISSEYEKYDAFAVYIDSQNMDYTASMLSYMLENLSKPIVVVSSDLSGALVSVSETKIPEVMIYSNGKLYRAVKTEYTGTGELSHTYPALTSQNSLKLPEETEHNVKLLDPDARIDVIRLYPGMNQTEAVNKLQTINNQSVILDVHDFHRINLSSQIYNVLSLLQKKDVVVVYKHNSDPIENLIKLGIPGGKFTLPGIFAKLHFLISHVKDPNIIRQLIMQNFRGELG